jgi:CYTH domain-containing protein
MPAEIERKFITDGVPDSGRSHDSISIRQGYLAAEGDIEVRLRITPDRSSLTVKAGHGMSRTEVDVVIPRSDAEELWPHTAGRQVRKRRMRLEVPGGVAEVDSYEGPLEGVHTVEVEFGSERDARAFRPPDWFGREITGDPRWSNEALARRGPPPRPW